MIEEEKNQEQQENEIGVSPEESFQEGPDTYGVPEKRFGRNNIAFVIFIVAGALVIFYLLFSGGNTPEKDEPPTTSTPGGGTAQQNTPPPPPPDMTENIVDTSVEQLPDIDTTSLIPPPPPPTDVTPPGSIISSPRGTDPFSGQAPVFTEAELAKMKGPMIVFGGAVSEPIIGGVQPIDGSIAGLKDTIAPKIEITKTANPSRTIIQGKMIDAVVESAINTELPGLIRALVSRDVYSESGRNILIPKGSRIVGNYATGVGNGQTRMFIIWDRVIRPDGIDISLSSPAVDNLGRTGVEAYVDKNYLEKFANSMLISAFTVGFNKAVEGVAGVGNVTQGETGSGDTVTSGNPSDIATLEALRNFSTSVNSIVSGFMSVPDVMLLDQGTKIKIFVNKDILFPGNLEYGSGFTFIR